jgi:hypothetical protein
MTATRERAERRAARRQARRRAQQQGLSVFTVREHRELPAQTFAARTFGEAVDLAMRAGYDRRSYDSTGARRGVWGRLFGNGRSAVRR